MKLSQLIIALGLVVTIGVTGAVMAQDTMAEQHGEHQHAGHISVKRMLAGLDLTDSQQQQIRQLLQQHRTEQQATQADKAARQQLHALLEAEYFDEATARQLLQQQQQQHLERHLSALKLQHQIRQILTAEQRAKLAEKRQKWQHKRQQRQPS